MRLRNPKTGTVVGLTGELAETYLAMGWVDADAKPTSEPEAKPEPVKRGPGRPAKNQ